MVGRDEGSRREERGGEEERLELRAGSKLDFEVEDPDGDVVKIMGNLSDGYEVLTREVREDIGLELGGDGGEHREEGGLRGRGRKGVSLCDLPELLSRRR